MRSGPVRRVDPFVSVAACRSSLRVADLLQLAALIEQLRRGEGGRPKRKGARLSANDARYVKVILPDVRL